MIVESPAKCKKIKSYLGDGWVVEASYGHIRDLPSKAMGVSLDNYQPCYEVTKKSVRNVAKLKKLASEASMVYLATDPDREGEAIAWHLREVLKLNQNQYKRISYREVTQSAILKALELASDIDFNLVKAQEGRRVLDRLVGYSVSPVLSHSYGSWLTAGRVQSVAVRIVVEREIAIRNFKPTSYFDVYLEFINDNLKWRAKWISADYLEEGQKYFQDENTAKRAASVREVRIVSYETRQETRRPPAPCITSTLQQAASAVLKISPKQTMKLAQTLFEEGLITYHRTDNPNLSEEGYDQVTRYLRNAGFADDCVSTMNTWKLKKDAQEGHEAIRPTDVSLVPETVLNTHRDEQLAQVYQLIWLRSVASQMRSAEYNVVTVTVVSVETKVCGQLPRYLAQGKEVLYQGWLKLGSSFESSDSDDDIDSDEQTLPALKKEELLEALNGFATAKKTKAPARYTEASLIRKMETEGVGRPSTYASILENINFRGYIEINQRKLHATELGFVIHNALVGRCAFMELSYTRSIEDQLDLLAKGQINYEQMVGTVYQQLVGELEELKVAPGNQQASFDCPKCSSNLRLIKNKFWGCNNYPECKYTANNVDGKPVESTKAVNNNTTDIDCPNCSGKLISLTTKQGKNKGKQFYRCSKSPACNYFQWLQ